RHRIMEMTGLPARDLRMLDPLLSYPSTILGRDRAIVVNLEHVRAIVTAAEVLVRDPSNPRLRPFLQELHARLALPDAVTTNPATDGGDDQGNVPISGSAKIPPFEFKVLEVCLEHTSKCMETETSVLESEAYPALDELTTKVSTSNLDDVRQIKNRLVQLSGRVQKVRDDIEHLLDDDTDMCEMYLTRKLAFQGVNNESSVNVDSNKHAFPDHDHDHEKEEEDRGGDTASSHGSSACVKHVEELEMLLEAYFVEFDGTLNKLCHVCHISFYSLLVIGLMLC
uniref:Magnesium transporter n=1 Tax=Aegilops tauschii subsp. strangulata TaxID=200361 RepID=A0A453G0Q9_AEGTS